MIRQKKRSRWLLCCSAALLAVAFSCTSADETEPFIPPPVGARQPGAGGSALSEREACERVRAAEESSRVRLQCEELERAECPFYVRPAGTGCWEYSEESVEACEQEIADYSACEDFQTAPCILTASPSSDQCPAPGSGGAGGRGDGSGGEPAAAGGAGGEPPLGGAGGVLAGAGGAAGAS